MRGMSGVRMNYSSLPERSSGVLLASPGRLPFLDVRRQTAGCVGLNRGCPEPPWGASGRFTGETAFGVHPVATPRSRSEWSRPEMIPTLVYRRPGVLIVPRGFVRADLVSTASRVLTRHLS